MASLWQNKQEHTLPRKMTYTAITDLMSCLIARFTLSKINYMRLYPLSGALHRGLWTGQKILLRFKESSFLSVTQLLPIMELIEILASFLHFFSAYGRVKFFNELVDFLRWHWEWRNVLCHCLDKSQAPFVNNRTSCNKPGGNVSNLGNNLSNKN